MHWNIKRRSHTFRNPESFCHWWTNFLKERVDLIWVPLCQEWIILGHRMSCPWTAQRMGPSIPNPWWSPTKSKVPWDPFLGAKAVYVSLILNNICGMYIPNKYSPPKKKFSIYPCISHDYVIFVPSSSKPKPPFFFPPERNVCHGGRSDFNPSFAGMECWDSAIFQQSSVSRGASVKNIAIFWCFLWLKPPPPQKKSGWVSTRILVPQKNVSFEKAGGERCCRTKTWQEIFWKGWRYVG